MFWCNGQSPREVIFRTAAIAGMPDLGPSANSRSAAGTMTVSQQFCGFFFSLRLMSLMSLITESAYNVETKTIAVDYSRADIYPKIEKGLAGLEIGILGKVFFVLYVEP